MGKQRKAPLMARWFHAQHDVTRWLSAGSLLLLLLLQAAERDASVKNRDYLQRRRLSE
jgi:hypothetical protein